MCSRTILTLLLVAGSAISAEPAPSSSTSPYGIGDSITADDIAAINLSVLPNGIGLPNGAGTAREGAAIYATHCSACHGDNGEGRGDYVPLVGGRGSLSTPQPLLTVGSYWPTASTVFDYIRRAMPYNTPGILSNDEVYALTAWILEKNQIIESGVVLDRTTLPKVQMPNRNGFVPDPRPDVGASQIDSARSIE